MKNSDADWMQACLRLARRNRGRTATNPSVGTLLVKDGIVVGSGVTAIGGRPHAERLALDEAADCAKGATAYVTLEPCAHHAATPPCAQALIDAGVTRVVAAYIDPDERVDGKGYAMLREAGIIVEAGVCEAQAGEDLAGYLTRKRQNRPHVTLKFAQSADGYIGRAGEEVAITGPVAVSYGHRMRAEMDAIAVGHGTVEADDPSLTCRLEGLTDRSPHRFVFASQLDLATNLATTARVTPTTLVSATPPSAALAQIGVCHMPVEFHEGVMALPEVLEDMAAQGISSLMVEGGAKLAQSFLDAGLVDVIALFRSPDALGSGIKAPVIPQTFNEPRHLTLGADTLTLYAKA
jgi:diaminohydroxyphosphoribosylaminopyrimidine deaminase/5-amino-6-(5-phosphoribosylamino)uracil reductase